MAGFPTTRLPRKIFPLTPAATKIPFVFPAIVFSLITLPVSLAAGRPIPKLLPWDEYPLPISRFARSRLPLVPASHMPPHGAPTVPFRIETLFSSRLFDPPLTIMPEVQLVDEVTPVTVTPVLVRS